MAILLQFALAALVKLFWKICSESFFEAVMSKAIVAALEKLASISTNRVDDEIVADIKARLAPAGPEDDFLKKLTAAAEARDFAEISRLTNERAGRS